MNGEYTPKARAVKATGAPPTDLPGFAKSVERRAWFPPGAIRDDVLGWMIVGSIAILLRHDRPHRRLYLASLLCCFVSFLLIAFGIDGLSAIKPIGVLGLSVAIPVAQLAFLRATWRVHPTAFVGAVSFIGLVFTLFLAWQNELGLLTLRGVLGARAMVSVHGLINGVVVAPCFLIAVALEARSTAVATGASKT